MRVFFLGALLLTGALATQDAMRATPTLKAFSFLDEGSGKLIPNPSLEVARSAEIFERPFTAESPVPAVRKREKAALKPPAEEPKKGDKFMQVDPAEAKKEVFRQQMRQNERSYYDQLHLRKKEYYQQIDKRNLLID